MSAHNGSTKLNYATPPLACFGATLPDLNTLDHVYHVIKRAGIVKYTRQSFDLTTKLGDRS